MCWVGVHGVCLSVNTMRRRDQHKYERHKRDVNYFLTELQHAVNTWVCFFRFGFKKCIYFESAF